MEPSGRNQWQPVANGTTRKTAHISRSANGKERVNGSSPLEGSKVPVALGFLLFDLAHILSHWIKEGLA
jgi:hypothetical protein